MNGVIIVSDNHEYVVGDDSVWSSWPMQEMDSL